MKAMRLWLTICGLLLGSPALFAQYTLEYSTNGGDITLTGYTGTPENVAIPDFVTMDTQEGATAAIAALNGKEFQGRALTVNEARPREERPPGGGGGRRY